ncbi:hypothetical protein [Klebsiella grimontii]|uniref:hypothetical protein n=1 Tax=Klebsiella grimontii TaxID=2058152 RepID=UPI0012B77560|nr:hypothetical protein [Klebsiella grimontii]MBZ7124663.1 hypothetical protein [Klebsiella grimontii]
MTSKLTRDELNEVVSTYGKSHIAHRMAVELLAAMDSEPVAWMHNNNNIGIPAITVSPKIGNYWMSEFKDVQPLYRHAQIPKAATDCANAEFGTYSGQIHIVAPNGKPAGIDACILSEVVGLWEAGITTIESCCGHNKASSYIAVAEEDAGRMRALGYELDASHPSGCVFYSKTSLHGRATQPAPVVPEDVRQALSQMDDEIIAELDAEESARRAAMLNGGKS